jgi:hypothetical protein
VLTRVRRSFSERPLPSSPDPGDRGSSEEGETSPAKTADTAPIGCLLALLALISPRLVLFILWLASNVLSRAFDSWIVPLLGFFLLPWTTLTYAAFWEWGSGHHVTGFEWFFVILAFLIDLGAYGGGRRAREARA